MPVKVREGERPGDSMARRASGRILQELIDEVGSKPKNILMGKQNLFQADGGHDCQRKRD